MNATQQPHENMPEALRLAAWLQEGAWHKMTLGDVEAAGRELRRLHALVVQSEPKPTSVSAPRLPLLAADHTGMRVDYSGLLSQCQRGLRNAGGHSANAEMLRQLQDHMKELGQRWYAGDVAVVDEILQLYCIEKDARAALKAR